VYKQNKAIIMELADAIKREETKKKLENDYQKVKWRTWQSNILEWMEDTTDDREIKWVVDTIENSGKTFLSKYMQIKGAIRFENGKSADLKRAYNGQDVVIFDLSRSQEDQAV